MEVKIVKGSLEYISDCEEALVNSELGIRYFSKEGSAIPNLYREGITEHLMMKLRTEKS